jgi:hypothetical protein
MSHVKGKRVLEYLSAIIIGVFSAIEGGGGRRYKLRRPGAQLCYVCFCLSRQYHM